MAGYIYQEIIPAKNAVFVTRSCATRTYCTPNILNIMYPYIIGFFINNFSILGNTKEHETLMMFCIIGSNEY